jgi:hypothetical protein
MGRVWLCGTAEAAPYCGFGGSAGIPSGSPDFLHAACSEKKLSMNFFKIYLLFFKIKKLHPKFDDAPHIHTPHVLNPQMQKTTFS